jgi:protein gp37
MADHTEIAWCDSTFNPWIGCTKVGPGCDNCYAELLDKNRFSVAFSPLVDGQRLQEIHWGHGAARHRTKLWSNPPKWNTTPFYQCLACGNRFALKKQGEVTCDKCGGDRVKGVRRRVFCASLADVFDNEVEPAWRADLLMLIRATPNLDWLLLTKRIGNVTRLLQEAQDLLRAQDRLDGWDWLNDWTSGSSPANVWLGATIVNQEEADRDVPKLLATPARVRFLSMEPLLGPVSSRREWLDGTYQGAEYADFFGGKHHRIEYGPRLSWVIAGGESGPHARPMHPDWDRSLRDQCAAAGVPFLFKQWGEWAPWARVPEDTSRLRAGDSFSWLPDGRGAWSYRVGKKAAGRLLDGVTHDAFPEVEHA